MALRSRFPGLVGILIIILIGCGIAEAIFSRREFENVPIDRVLRNLERRAADNPRDVETRINLARVHAMAYSSKSEMTPVRIRQNSNVPPDEPYVRDTGPQFGTVVQATSPAAISQARLHLTKAIENYEAAIAIEPSNFVARLGHAWCLDQSGDKQRAIAGYRGLLKDIPVRRDTSGLTISRSNQSVAWEAAGYLIPLLDPVKDEGEINELRERVKIGVPNTLRPITPIVIPLADNLRVSDVLQQRFPVWFDADGSGLRKRWTWISAKGGWLVFDKRGRKQVSSGLELFGNVTFWLFWENGYEALCALDDDGDGELRGAELSGLAIWRDVNFNGAADPGEVKSLADWHITGLSCDYELREDDPDSIAWSARGVTFADGTVRPTFDLLLYRRD